MMPRPYGMEAIMARFLTLLPLILVAGCSQPPSAVDLSTASQSAAVAGAQGVAGRSAGGAQARCAGANWHATGYRHGISGYPLSALSQVNAACDGTGVKVDRLAYSTGRLEGLGLFCSIESGYRRALAGEPMDNPCPPTLAEQYEAGYARGLAAR